MKEAKLLNCPLCDSLSGLHIVDTREYIREYTGKIQCSECDLMLQMTLSDVSELRTSLIKAWNTRKPMERIIERLEDASFTKNLGNNMELVILKDRAIEIVKEEGGIEQT